jgi:hypothetical protein
LFFADALHAQFLGSPTFQFARPGGLLLGAFALHTELFGLPRFFFLNAVFFRDREGGFARLPFFLPFGSCGSRHAGGLSRPERRAFFCSPGNVAICVKSRGQLSP